MDEISKRELAAQGKAPAKPMVNSPIDAQHEHILQFFTYEHLPPALQEVSKSFSVLAHKIMELPRNPERTVALRKLLEAKDAAVRAKIAK